MIQTANMSGYSASTPGAFIVMYRLQNSSIYFPIILSKVALHARATLAVPEQRKPSLPAEQPTPPAAFCFQAELTNDIGEDEVPASDEGPQLAHCHVGVEVSRTCFGNTGSKFSVAQTCQDRSQGSDEEREDNGGSRGVPGHSSGQHVHASAQSAADAQSHQIQCIKASGEVGLFRAAVHNLHSQEL